MVKIKYRMFLRYGLLFLFTPGLFADSGETTQDKQRIDAFTNKPRHILEILMAQVGEADYLVTGDHRAGLLQHKSRGRTRIAKIGRAHV
jgi:hypothetical protein